MKVDVSEIKDFRHCTRKWQFASRNSFHLRPKVTPSAFKMGTVFHECLHRMYLGKLIDEVLEYMEHEMDGSDSKETTVLRSMVKGYMEQVMPEDEALYEVLDIEYHFEFSPIEVMSRLGIKPVDVPSSHRLYDVTVVGSIDMIALNRETNEVWGFEHKTAKNFRNNTYLWMDEQPRLYFIALMLWVEAYNKRKNKEWLEKCNRITLATPIEELRVCDLPSEPTPVKLGGVFINEVRKLVRMFDYKRSKLTYEASDIRNFMFSFFASCAECHKMVNKPYLPRVPQPDMMTCSTCSFNTLCQKYQYADVTVARVLAENDDFKVRESDHLDDKEEVKNE